MICSLREAYRFRLEIPRKLKEYFSPRIPAKS